MASAMPATQSGMQARPVRSCAAARTPAPAVRRRRRGPTPQPDPAQNDPAVIRETTVAQVLTVCAVPGYQAPAGGFGRHVEFLGWRRTEMVAELIGTETARKPARELDLLQARYDAGRRNLRLATRAVDPGK